MHHVDNMFILLLLLLGSLRLLSPTFALFAHSRQESAGYGKVKEGSAKILLMYFAPNGGGRLRLSGPAVGVVLHAPL